MYGLWPRRGDSNTHNTLQKLNENRLEKNVNYDKLFNGTVDEKLEIAKIFKENYDLLENMKK